MDAKKPLVSVIMSVYNGEAWLDDAIQSIIRQTYDNWEFIIIDDASNETSQQILNKYKNDPRIRIIRQSQRNGLTKNLNMAAGLVKGGLIARMDADDISLSDRFKKQVEYLQQHPATSLVACFIEFIDEKGIPKGVWKDDRERISNEQIRSLLPWRSCIAHPTVMFRKKLLEEFKYNETQTHSQDWDLWLRLADHGKVMEKIPERLLLYRVHDKSTTSLSNRGFALRKMQQTYRAYLQSIDKGRKFSPFNRRVWIAFLFNSVKLFLSRIKRAFSS
jgi:glycosyltransferase involved in cell wall biosynthesis